MSVNETSEQPWMDAARRVYWDFEAYSSATTPIAQAKELSDLQNSVHDLITWVNGWDWERGILTEEVETS